MSFDDCTKAGLIRKSETATERIEQSLLLADKFLRSAEKNLGIGENEVCEIIAYNALFHYARALLFKKGYLERSHACLFLALKKLYPDQNELIEGADKIRGERHNLQYSGLLSNRDSAEFVLDFVKRFGKEAKELLRQ